MINLCFFCSSPLSLTYRASASGAQKEGKEHFLWLPSGRQTEQGQMVVWEGLSTIRRPAWNLQLLYSFSSPVAAPEAALAAVALPPGNAGSPWSWWWCIAHRWPHALRSTAAGGCGPAAPRHASTPSPGIHTCHRHTPRSREGYVQASESCKLPGSCSPAACYCERWGKTQAAIHVPWNRSKQAMDLMPEEPFLGKEQLWYTPDKWETSEQAHCGIVGGSHNYWWCCYICKTEMCSVDSTAHAVS